MIAVLMMWCYGAGEEGALTSSVQYWGKKERDLEGKKTNR